MQLPMYFMLILLLASAPACNGWSQPKDFALREKLPGRLDEVSGVYWHNGNVWAISDKPRPLFFRLNPKGKVQQDFELKNAKVTDVEAITGDGTHLYIGDVGDNNGSRKSRKIYVVPLAALQKDGDEVTVDFETIEFNFEGNEQNDNDFDCEAMLSAGNHLYLFTKRRSDDACELFRLPKQPGKQLAVNIGRFNTKGMVTDAAISASGRQVALIGYNKGHDDPFIWLLSGFSGDDFFGGRQQKISIGSKKREWQVEGITFKGDDELYFSCEDAGKVPATLYRVPISHLGQVKHWKP